MTPKRFVARTWVTVLAVLALLVVLSWPTMKFIITYSIARTDPVRPAKHLVIENWSGEVELFDQVKSILPQIRPDDISTIIFDRNYVNARKRQLLLMAAWAAGLDTATLRLIPVPHEEPKTLHIATAVIDSAHARGWQEITIATVDLHSARSRKSYLIAAQRYGISVHVIGLPHLGITRENWTANATGMAMAFSEFVKRVYYEFVVF